MSSLTNNSLLILLFNANGLKNHVNELQLVLQEKRIDIALISETHFTKYSYVLIIGYNLLKTYHPDNTAHGGAVIYVKSSILFQTLPNFCQPYLQSCAILLHLNNILTTIAAIYSPPRHGLTTQNYVDFFSTLSIIL
jgi:exonuclease III